MTVAAPPLIAEPPAPDTNRMSIGEHLEELRRRLIYALIGFAVIAGVCFFFGQQVMSLFCRPLITVLIKKNLNPQLFYGELAEGFMVYMKISLICAAVFSAPWMIWQIWQFIAAGLYPHERKYVTKYVPLSIGLLISGMLFVYIIVLPWTIDFFVSFGDSIKLPTDAAAHVADNVPASGLPRLPILNGDPMSPSAGAFWFDAPESRLKFFVKNGDVRVIQFGPENLLSPHISLGEYIDLVINTLLSFGLAFQLPIVVVTLVKIGIVKIEQLRSLRRYIYFAISIIAASLTPGDMVTAMIALMVPLIGLYELGIILAAWNGKPVTAATANDAENA